MSNTLLADDEVGIEEIPQLLPAASEEAILPTVLTIQDANLPSLPDSIHHPEDRSESLATLENPLSTSSILEAVAQNLKEQKNGLNGHTPVAMPEVEEIPATEEEVAIPIQLPSMPVEMDAETANFCRNILVRHFVARAQNDQILTIYHVAPGPNVHRQMSFLRSYTERRDELQMLYVQACARNQAPVQRNLLDEPEESLMEELSALAMLPLSQIPPEHHKDVPMGYTINTSAELRNMSRISMCQRMGSIIQTSDLAPLLGINSAYQPDPRDMEIATLAALATVALFTQRFPNPGFVPGRLPDMPEEEEKPARKNRKGARNGGG